MWGHVTFVGSNISVAQKVENYGWTSICWSSEMHLGHHHFLDIREVTDCESSFGLLPSSIIISLYKQDKTT